MKIEEEEERKVEKRGGKDKTLDEPPSRQKYPVCISICQVSLQERY